MRLLRFLLVIVPMTLVFVICVAATAGGAAGAAWAIAARLDQMMQWLVGDATGGLRMGQWSQGNQQEK